MNRLIEIAMNIYQMALDKHEARIVNNILSMESFIPVVNKEPKNIEKIAFVVPTLRKFAGGHTSILRLGTYIANTGIDVSYISFHNQNIDEMEKVAKENLPNVKGSFRKYSDSKDYKFDVCIATSWESVYWAKQLDGYKVYFVQDYEPLFFKLNERYLLAKKTYELGFHIISLGKWNVKQIERECLITSPINSVSFPYEPAEYELIKRNYKSYKNKKKFSIAVYTKEEGKRIPNLLQGVLKKASDELLKYGIELDITFFGLKKNHKVSIGVNAGKLTKEELVDLYSKSDFGLVASMTNISLVPYEMIATGLPVIEFIEGSYKEFLPADSAILIDYNYNILVEKLIDVIQHPEKIEYMINSGLETISKLSWSNTGKEFLDLLIKQIRNEE